MIGKEVLKINTILFAQESKDPSDVPIIVLQLVRGVVVLHSKSDPKVGLIQVCILVFLKVDIVVVDVWIVL